MVLEVEVTSRRENPLLERTEVHFIISHDGERTPKRDVIREEIATLLNVKKERVVVDNVKPEFGWNKAKGYAKIYSSKKKAQEFEREHILKRNHLLEETKKKEKKEKKPAE